MFASVCSSVCYTSVRYLPEPSLQSGERELRGSNEATWVEDRQQSSVLLSCVIRTDGAKMYVTTYV